MTTALSMADLEPETLASLFESDCRFAVPPYQRAYSWENSQVDQFLEDVARQPSTKPYYLGHFLFERKSRDSLFLIDGQQRLSTVILFMGAAVCVLKERAETQKAITLRQRYIERDDGKQRFQTVEADKELFAGLSRTGQSGIAVASRSRSQNRIQSAWDKLLGYLKGQTTTQILALADVIERAHITHLVVRDKVQATQIFTLQNSRGKALTELEKFKAWLMYQVHLHSPEQEENEAIASIERQFATIYITLEEIKLLTEDHVLRHHHQAFSPHWKSPVENLELELKTRQGPAAVQYLADHAIALAASYQYVKNLEKLLHDHEAIADLVILSAQDTWPLLIKLYAIHGPELVRSPDLLALLKDIAITLLKFRFLSGHNKNHLPDYAKKFGDGMYNLKWLTNLMKETSMYGFTPNQSDNFRKAFLNHLHGDQHYHWTSRFILWKYENSLRHSMDERISPAVYLNATTSDRGLDATLEHIAPRNPQGAAHSQEFERKYLNNLGNLLFMKKRLNSSQGNRPVEDKAPILGTFTHLSYRAVPDMMNRPCGEAGCTDKWCPHKILARKESIVAFAIKEWRVY